MPTPASPRILIVDDEAEITEILADLLSDRLQTLRHVQSGASYNPLGARRASMHVHPKTALIFPYFFRTSRARYL